MVLINGVVTLYVEKLLAWVTCFFVLIRVTCVFLFFIDMIIISVCSLLNHVPDINCI